MSPDKIENYWSRKASELIGRTDAKRRRIELRGFFEDRIFFYLRVECCVLKEAERKSFEDLQRVIGAEKV